MSALNRLYKTHSKTIDFYVVYIREAHAADGDRPMSGNVNEPKTFGERLSVASTCRLDLGLKLPVLIDDMKNSTDAAYFAMPDRLFLVDTKGKIAFAGGRGPRGFRPAELEAAIKKLLGTPAKPKLSDAKRKEIIERLKARRRAQLEGKKTE
ncbi:MAG: hypothetical protein JKY65_10140 [Planctomycetes bacterium]|nr:hypothetical protein [Planctomycetota bacterium]